MKKELQKYSIFYLNGGLGKHVAATAVAKTIKNNYSDRELIIVCAYPEVFLNLDFIDRVYRTGNTPYFYKDYIDGKDSILFGNEPYFTTGHVHKKTRLAKTWADMYNLTDPVLLPEIKFNKRQVLRSHELWKRDKPVLILHTNGGPFEQQYDYAWARDIPPVTAWEIAEKYNKKYHIIQLCRNEKQILPNVHETIYKPMSNMELFGMLIHSEKRILIDSCLQHAAAALNLPSTVLWIGTSPDTFGHDLHYNIKANLEHIKLPDSFLFDFGFNGALHECPNINEEIKFDINNLFKTKA